MSKFQQYFVAVLIAFIPLNVFADDTDNVSLKFVGPRTVTERRAIFRFLITNSTQREITLDPWFMDIGFPNVYVECWLDSNQESRKWMRSAYFRNSTMRTDPFRLAAGKKTEVSVFLTVPEQSGTYTAEACLTSLKRSKTTFSFRVMHKVEGNRGDGETGQRETGKRGQAIKKNKHH